MCISVVLDGHNNTLLYRTEIVHGGKVAMDTVEARPDATAGTRIEFPGF